MRFLLDSFIMCRHIDEIRNISNVDLMLLTNARLATMATDGPYGLIEDGAIAIAGERIAWAGAASQLPPSIADEDRQDLGGRLVTPALIDCHTHIVFGGNRAHEFEMRLEGATYEELARAGGGIVATVTATRAASADELVRLALPRVDALLAEGVSTIEIKSGYGLDDATEHNMLRAAREIARQRPVTIKTSFLGAHAVPAEYDGCGDTYIDQVCIPALAAAHEQGLVDAVDGFCEGIAFTPAQIERVFKTATELGLPVKLHAEQLSNLGGSKLAARYGALSADHIEYANEDDVKALAAAGTVAVLLPGAFYTLRETQLPPIDALRRHGVAIALATDCNPGSSPLASLLLALNMACTLFRLTPHEALTGVTRHAAKALGIGDAGQLANRLSGQPCRVGHRATGRVGLPYRFQPAPCAHAPGQVRGVTTMSVVLTPGAATLSQLETIWRSPQTAIALDPSARPNIEASAQLVRAAASGGDAVYGVNTGFGKLATVKIAPEDTETLQRNLILSHCCGVGEPVETATTRLMMALKLLSLGRGASGVRWQTVAMLQAMLDKGVTPVVPARGFRRCLR